MVYNLILAFIVAILTVSAIKIDTNEHAKNKDDESDGSEYVAYNSLMSIRKFMEQKKGEFD